MKSYRFLIIFSCFIGVYIAKLFSINDVNAKEIIKQSIPKISIESVETYPFNVKNRWLCLPKQDGELTVNIKAKHVKKIKFYLTPTGTGTANLRKFIGETKSNTEDFVFIWKFKATDDLLDHFSYIAYGKNDVSFEDMPFNVTNDCYGRQKQTLN